jgi:putative sterol carrier protein
MQAKEFFATLEQRADVSRIEGIDHSYLFVIEGEGQWVVDVRDGSVRVTEGGGDADVTISLGAETFEKLASGRQNPVMAYMTGKLKVHGDTGAALKLQKLF